uniref:Uncharacterized protein n=1 Tax=Micrurus corallinus TaxID=54390 RepID=A0A2D4FNM5_MICCO
MPFGQPQDGRLNSFELGSFAKQKTKTHACLNHNDGDPVWPPPGLEICPVVPLPATRAVEKSGEGKRHGRNIGVFRAGAHLPAIKPGSDQDPASESMKTSHILFNLKVIFLSPPPLPPPSAFVCGGGMGVERTQLQTMHQMKGGRETPRKYRKKGEEGGDGRRPLANCAGCADVEAILKPLSLFSQVWPTPPWLCK